MKPFQSSAATLPTGMRVKAPTRDIAGVRFGKLVAVSVVGKHTNNSLIWSCQCDCGGWVERTSASLQKGKGVASCGCYMRQLKREHFATATPWNKGASYTLKDEFVNRHSWASAVLRERGNKCEMCGWDKARCDVHHRLAKSKGGKHTVENGIVLCPNCHRIEHESGRGD